MPEGLDIHTDKKIYSIPDGLNELMYDISKEVLRSQPKNLYKFISDYLITMLKVREAVKVAVPIIEQEFDNAESQSNFLKKYNLTKEQGDQFATIIQAAFRGYRTRRKLLHIADDVVKEERLKDDFMNQIDITDPVFKDLKTRGVSLQKTVEAATKIQAFYRGYKLRKMEKEKGLQCIIQGVPSHESWRHDWLSESLPKKTSGQEMHHWRKEFADFQKSYTRRLEGDRLHMETIYRGKYEDYNWVCDQTSCQEFVIPTRAEAVELGVPGDIEPSVSDIQDIPGRSMMHDILMEKAKAHPISYEKADAERMFFEGIVKKKSEVMEERSEEKKLSQVPTRGTSQARISKEQRKSSSITSTPRSEGSKSKISRKSSAKETNEGEAEATPELSVRSLEGSLHEAEEAVSRESQATTQEDQLSQVSEARNEDQGSVGSKASKVSQVSTAAPDASDLARLSKVSKTSGGSASNRRSGGSSSNRKSAGSARLKKSTDEALPEEAPVETTEEIPAETE